MIDEEPLSQFHLRLPRPKAMPTNLTISRESAARDGRIGVERVDLRPEATCLKALKAGWSLRVAN
jgi:hypothetical protein